MAFEDLPSNFNLVLNGKKTPCKIRYGTYTTVGDGFVYDENGEGYGLCLDTTQYRYIVGLLDLSGKDELTHKPFMATYKYHPCRGEREEAKGYYALCNCQVEAFGKTLTSKVIIFFKNQGAIPFFVFHDVDEEKTIARFNQLKEELA
jgi:hypothetical protein